MWVCLWTKVGVSVHLTRKSVVHTHTHTSTILDTAPETVCFICRKRSSQCCTHQLSYSLAHTHTHTLALCEVFESIHAVEWRSIYFECPLQYLYTHTHTHTHTSATASINWGSSYAVILTEPPGTKAPILVDSALKAHSLVGWSLMPPSR